MAIPSSGFALSYLVISSPSLTLCVPRTSGCINCDNQKIRKPNILIIPRIIQTAARQNATQLISQKRLSDIEQPRLMGEHLQTKIRLVYFTT